MMRNPRVEHGHRRPDIAICLAFALLWIPPAALAQEGPRPTLGGHHFVSTDLVPDAFVRTYVRNSLGYTMTSEFDYPAIVVGGDTLAALDGSLAYALLGMEYQHAIRDWIAVRAALGLRTRLGTQMSSLINEGMNVTSGIELGWLVRVHEGSRTSLVGSLDVTRQTLTVIDLRQFTEDVIEGDPDPSLIDDVPMVRSNGGLRFAYALSRTFGVTLLAEGSYGESPQGDDSWEHGFGASVDLDGSAAWDVPVGLVLAYRQTSLPALTTSNNGNVRQALLRIAYTGESDFLIALDVLGVLDRENLQADSVWAGGAAFSLRYYF